MLPSHGEVVIDTNVIFRNVYFQVRHERTPRLVLLARTGSVRLVTAPHVIREAHRLLPKMARASHATVADATEVLSAQLDLIEVRDLPLVDDETVHRVTHDDPDDAPLASLAVALGTVWLLSDDRVFSRAGLQPAHERSLLELLQIASGVDAGIGVAVLACVGLADALRVHINLAVAGLAGLGILIALRPDRFELLARRAGRAALDALVQRELAIQLAATQQIQARLAASRVRGDQ